MTQAHTTRTIRQAKGKNLQMLTCYDFQMAQLLNQTDLDMILVGDSLGNVILGHDTTVEVTLTEMGIFGKAVVKGARNKFVVVDLPFGSYADFEKGISNAINLFQETKAHALKLEGAFDYQLQLVQRLTQNGVPIMGHIGLRPQSVHQQGGYYTHGKKAEESQALLNEAKSLEQAGCFAIVLECVHKEAAKLITESLNIPTIGIGSGRHTDGQVLVVNDLLRMGPSEPPKFCQPMANLFEYKKQVIEHYLQEQTKMSEKQTEASS